MKCLIPTNKLQITQDTTLEPGVYYLPDGISLAGSNLTLDGNGAILVGNGRQGTGIRLEDCTNVTLRNLTILEYFYGIQAARCQELTISHCRISATAEMPANTDFLDVWLPAKDCYGGGIFLSEIERGVISDNDLQHQMNGVHFYGCHGLKLERNNASYCSGWGFHLYDTSDCIFENNWADYCCRYQPRGERIGHMGADAAGFLIVYKSCRNIFRHNYARMGGDGFFLAGMNSQFESVGCDDNLFEENDGSYSPNIAFEATFSRGNIYRNNLANHCNYGFWLGFSSEAIVENNQMRFNRQAGIATENGVDMTVRGNRFENCTYGVLLWAKRLPQVEKGAPKNTTSANWLIEANEFRRNGTAIRIAANQDHGIRPLPVSGEWGLPAPKPHHHTIRHNALESNLRNYDLDDALDTNMEE